MKSKTIFILFNNCLHVEVDLLFTWKYGHHQELNPYGLQTSNLYQFLILDLYLAVKEKGTKYKGDIPQKD